MTNITKLYQQLQEGKTTRDYFVREARRQFPQFISPVSPFNDIVNILKGKRLVSEAEVKDVSGAQFDAPLEPKEGTIGVDSTVKVLTGRYTGMLATVLKVKDGVVDVMVDSHRFPVITLPADEVELSQEQMSSTDEPMSNDRDEASYLTEAHKLDTEQILDRMSPYAVRKGIEVELKKEKVVDKTTLDKVRTRVAKKLQKNKEAYNDLVLANTKQIEKQDKDLETQEVKQELVDKKNAMRKPKGFKAEKANTKTSKRENKKGKPKGVKVMPDKGVIGTEKVIKESEHAITLETAAQDLEPLKNKIKVWYKDARYNPKSPLTQKWVEEFNSSVDTAQTKEELKALVHSELIGDKSTVDIKLGLNEIKQTVLNNLKEWLEENVYREYHVGMEVKTPDGTGVIKEVKGGTLTVELQDEEKTLKDYQYNIVNRLMDADMEEPKLGEPSEPSTTPEEKPVDPDKEARDKAFAKLPNLGSVRGNDGPLSKLFKQMSYEEKLKAIMEKVQAMEEGEKKQTALEIVKRKLEEAGEVVVGTTQSGEEAPITVVRSGGGSEKVTQLKKSGITSAKVKKFQ